MTSMISFYTRTSTGTSFNFMQYEEIEIPEKGGLDTPSPFPPQTMYVKRTLGTKG